MNGYFLDASALVKRYTDEVGSEWVRQITDSEAGNTILLAEEELPAPFFVASDTDLIAAAKLERMITENPLERVEPYAGESEHNSEQEKQA